MNCPRCNVALTMADRQGVEIDYCPNCRGVWLDRGELDKILERAAALERDYRAKGYRGDDDDDDDDDDDHKRRQYPQQGYPPPPPAPGYPQQPYPQQPYPQQPYPPQGGYPPQQQPYGYGQHPYKHKKRKSFWEELFD